MSTDSESSKENRIETTFFADITLVDSCHLANKPPDLRVETTFGPDQNNSTVSPRKSVTFVDEPNAPGPSYKPIPPPRTLPKMSKETQTSQVIKNQPQLYVSQPLLSIEPSKSLEKQTQTSLEPYKPLSKPLYVPERNEDRTAISRKSFHASTIVVDPPPPYNGVQKKEKDNLKIETIFPVLGGYRSDLFASLTDVSMVSLYETKKAELCDNTSEWMICFENDQSNHFTWRLVDIERSCCNFFLPKYQFAVLGSGERRIFAATELNVMKVKDSSVLTVSDSYDQMIGAVTTSTDCNYCIKNRSDQTLFKIAETQPKWFNNERTFLFLAANTDLQITASRTHVSSGSLSGRVIYRINFEQSTQLDPIYKVLCIAAMIFIHKTQFRMQYTHNENEDEQKMNLSKLFCCFATEDEFSRNVAK